MPETNSEKNEWRSPCTVATVGPSGRRLHLQVAETNVEALIRVLRGIRR